MGFIGIGSTLSYVRERLINWPVFWWTALVGLILGALLGSYFGASLGIKKGNRFLRIMFLGTAATTGVILLYPWIRETVF